MLEKYVAYLGLELDCLELVEPVLVDLDLFGLLLLVDTSVALLEGCREEVLNVLGVDGI